MIEQIKEGFKMVRRKSELINRIAEKVPTKANTIKQSWLCDSGFWSVPEQYQAIVLEEIQSTLKNQNKE